jgi:exosortase/archaeosortase family protein
VEEACAGINSLFAVVTCTLFYILFARVPIIRAAFLMVAAVAWVLLANVTRVFLVAYLLKTRGIDLSEGARHDTLGFVLFAIALGLIWSSDRLLMFLASSRSASATPAPSDDANGQTASIGWGDLLAGVRGSWLASWLAGGAFGVLLAAHLVVHGFGSATVTAVPSVDMSRLRADSLPESLDGWKREKFEAVSRNPGSAFGEFSRTWTYRAETHRAALSVDYPYPNWHEAHECYLNQGWELEEMTDHLGGSPNRPIFYRAAKLTKAGMKCGYFFYTEFDQSGQSIEAERTGISAALDRYSSALGRWTDWSVSPVPRQAGPLSQFQLFVDSQTPLSRQALGESEQHFLLAYQLVDAQLFPAAKP